MGSRFDASLYGIPREQAERAWNEIRARLIAIDECLSDWRDDSEVARLRRTAKGSAFKASVRLVDVLSRSLSWAAETEGVFDPTVGPFTRLWRESRASHTLPDAKALAAARVLVGFRNVRVDEAKGTITPLVDDLSLDFGAVGKGLALREAQDVLRARGIDHYALDFGGDLLGTRTLTLPSGEVATTQADSVMTSGDAEQFVTIDGVRYSHIVDPRSGLGTTHTGDAVVAHDDPVLADFLATTLCIVPVDRMEPLLSRFGAEAIVRRDGKEVCRIWGRR